MFKVNNKDILVSLLLTLGVVLVSLLLTLEYFTPYSSVSIVNFEQINAGWEVNLGVKINLMINRVTFNLQLVSSSFISCKQMFTKADMHNRNTCSKMLFND